MNTLRIIAILALALFLLVTPNLTRTVRAPWVPPIAREESDLDGNGVINILDLAIAAVAFSQSCALFPCPPAWDTRADVNNDGAINILDLATIAFYWTASCGVPTPGWNSNADLDNDNDVDAADQAIFNAAFGSTLGGVGWNPEADVDGNAVVNIADASAVAFAFGSSC